MLGELYEAAEQGEVGAWRRYSSLRTPSAKKLESWACREGRAAA